MISVDALPIKEGEEPEKEAPPTGMSRKEFNGLAKQFGIVQAQKIADAIGGVNDDVPEKAPAPSAPLTPSPNAGATGPTPAAAPPPNSTIPVKSGKDTNISAKDLLAALMARPKDDEQPAPALTPQPTGPTPEMIEKVAREHMAAAELQARAKQRRREIDPVYDARRKRQEERESEGKERSNRVRAKRTMGDQGLAFLSGLLGAPGLMPRQRWKQREDDQEQAPVRKAAAAPPPLPPPLPPAPPPQGEQPSFADKTAPPPSSPTPPGNAAPPATEDAPILATVAPASRQSADRQQAQRPPTAPPPALPGRDQQRTEFKPHWLNRFGIYPGQMAPGDNVKPPTAPGNQPPVPTRSAARKAAAIAVAPNPKPALPQTPELAKALPATAPAMTLPGGSVPASSTGPEQQGRGNPSPSVPGTPAFSASKAPESQEDAPILATVAPASRQSADRQQAMATPAGRPQVGASPAKDRGPPSRPEFADKPAARSWLETPTAPAPRRERVEDDQVLRTPAFPAGVIDQPAARRAPLAQEERQRPTASSLPNTATSSDAPLRGAPPHGGHSPMASGATGGFDMGEFGDVLGKFEDAVAEFANAVKEMKKQGGAKESGPQRDGSFTPSLGPNRAEARPAPTKKVQQNLSLPGALRSIFGS